MYLETVNQAIGGDEAEENHEIGSFNHGYIQLRLGGLLDRLGQFTPVAELSLDISPLAMSQFELKTQNELIPDIALYSKRSLSRPTDIQRMNEYPLVAIEILSLRQGFDEILEKFKVYFALGIHSYWLVAPAINAVSVYSAPAQWTTFIQGDLIDERVGIRISLAELFA